MSGYVAHSETWVKSGRGMSETADALASAVDVLCGVLAGAGDAWGNDEAGRAFFDGDGSSPGYGAGRDAVLAELADMVNVLRGTGGLLRVSGRLYAVAEEASTVGSAVPEGAEEGALAEGNPYRLPDVTKGFAHTDPPPTGLEWVLDFVETLVGGCPLPDGDMEGLRVIAQAWHGMQDALVLAADEVRLHAQVVTDANAGDAAERFATFAAALHGGGDVGGLSWLAAVCGGLGSSVKNVMSQKQAAQLQFIKSLEFLAATWVLAKVLAPWTGGGSVVAATATTRAEGLALKGLLKQLLRAVLAGAWYSGGLDAMGQMSRIHFGVQKGWNAGESLVAVGEGALAGGVMTGAGAWVGAGSKGVRKALSGWLQASGVKGSATRLAFAGVSGTAGNAVSQKVFEGRVDWAHAAEFGFGMATIQHAWDAGKGAVSGMRGRPGASPSSRGARPEGTGESPAAGTDPPGSGSGSGAAARSGGGDPGGGRGSGQSPAGEAVPESPASGGKEPSGLPTHEKQASTPESGTGGNGHGKDVSAEHTGSPSEHTGSSPEHTELAADPLENTHTGPAGHDAKTLHPDVPDETGPVKPPAGPGGEPAPGLSSTVHVPGPENTPAPRSSIAELLGTSTTGSRGVNGDQAKPPIAELLGPHREGTAAEKPAAPDGAVTEVSSGEGVTPPLRPDPPRSAGTGVSGETGPPGETAAYGVQTPAGPGEAARQSTTAEPTPRPQQPSESLQKGIDALEKRLDTLEEQINVHAANVTGASPEHPPAGPDRENEPPTRTAEPTAGGGEPAAEPRPEIHPPRYTDYGALGDAAAVEGVRLPTDPAEAARRWAAALPDYWPPKVRADIEAYVRDLLSDPNIDRWTDLVQNGIAFESRGHVVWLKPKLDTYTYVEPTGGARRYTVHFGGTGSGAKEAEHVHRDESGGIVEILDSSDGLERVSLPGLGLSKVSGHSHTSATEVMAGHKSVALKHDFFEWTTRLEAHLDGAHAGTGGIVHDLSLTVAFPEQFHREGTLDGVSHRPPAPRHLVTSDRAPEVRKHDVIVTAIQADPMMTEFQRRALQAGIRPKRVVEIVNRELSGHLGQQVEENRSRDLLNGRLTTPDATVKTRVLRLEHLPESDTPIRKAMLRDDQGLVTTTNDGWQFGHKRNVPVGMKVGTDNPTAKFYARIGGNYQGGKNHVFSYSHTAYPKITLVREAELTRYHATVRMEIETRSGSFPVDVPMELAVRTSDAPRFETDLLGGVKTEGLLPPGSGEHAADPPSGTGPASRTGQSLPESTPGEHGKTTGAVESPGHGLPVHADPAHSPPLADHEPAHLAAGLGAGLGKLAAVPGSERVVTELRDAVHKALPKLSEPVRRQLDQALDARFGRSALEGRSLADVLHGDVLTITVGKHRIEISHRAKLGETRSSENFDMTVNDRKVAGTGTAAGQYKSSGGGAELGVNVRFKLGNNGLDAPKFVLHGGGSRSKSVTFLNGSTEYRRTETDGPVTQITKEMRHDVTLQVHDGQKLLTDQSWTVSGDDVSARIVVPQEHSPAAKVTPDEIAQVGRVDRLDALPDDLIDFAGLTTGVFPSFAASHDLPFQVARVEAEINGRPAPADLRGIPPEILEATRPSSLEAHLAELTSRDGWPVQVTQPDGSKRVLTLRAHFGAPEHVTARTGIEIEHYRAANSRMRIASSTDIRAGGQLKFGFRAEGTRGAIEIKGVAEAGGLGEVDSRTGRSEYAGGSDVIRGTYGSGGLTHSFSGSDLYLSVTHDALGQRHPETVHLRLHEGADFMMPHRIAQDHHLDHLAKSPEVHGQDGDPVVPTPVSEPRTYRPDMAVTSAHVERFDGGEVLPKVESMLKARGLLPENGLASELLRAAFDEPALAANMASLRRGVVQWYPVESAYGFTRHVGIRVRAVLGEGTHTAERPDITHMARVQGLSGSDTVRGRGFGRGWKLLGRGSAQRVDAHGEINGPVGGSEFGGGRTHRSENERSDGTGEKAIDRRQTREGSQEFTHGLRYEIEVVETKDPPYGLEHGISSIRRGADALARLTGNDAAARFFDRHLSAETDTATADGSVRLVVPHHLTTAAGEGGHVPGWTPVTGEFARWSGHTEPTAANRTLGDMVGRIAFPGAEVVHEYAALAALPPERRGPTPAETERPAGYELSRTQGMKLWKQTEPATMMSGLKSLLDHEYTVDGLRPGEKITVGMNVVALKEDARALFKRREYTQTATNQRDSVVRGTDSSWRGGGFAGTADGHGGMVSHGRGKGSATAREADSAHIRERNIEVTDPNIEFDVDFTLVFRRVGAPDLLVDVSNGLRIRLTEENAAELDRRHPGLIRRPVEPTARVREVSDSLQRDINALEERITFHTARVTEASPGAEVERQRQLTREYQAVLDQAIEAKSAHQALLDSLDRVDTEPQSGFLTKVLTDANGLLADQARDKLTSYREALHEVRSSDTGRPGPTASGAGAVPAEPALGQDTEPAFGQDAGPTVD